MKYLSFIIIYLCLSSVIVKAQFINVPLIATEAYNGEFAHGTLRVQYVIPGSLRRPLLVIEGFDPGHILKPEDQFGETSIEGFIFDIINDIPTPPATTTPLQDLLQSPVQQYDIVYLDWKNGTDYIQRNALLVEEAIRWINTQKELAGSTEPNAVLGQSMGGVAARYALRDMENKGQNHQTRLFISHDAPQQGANVPQGYQHLARHARDLYIQTGVTAFVLETIQIFRNGLSPMRALSVANEPAAKQMLVNYVNDFNNIDNSVHNQWQTDLQNMGYPQGVAGIPFKRVAISNGSECATTEPFSPGANLLTYQGKARTTFLSDLGLSGIVFSTAAGLFNQPAFVLGVLPGRNDFNFDFAVNSKATGTGNQVYKGKIIYTKKIMWLIPINVVITNRSYNAAAAALPYDYYPGGYYDLRAAGLDLQSSSSVNYWTKYNINVSYQPTFCFVPVTSALDIGSGAVALGNTDYLTRYSGGTPPLAPRNTPFQNFITASNNGNTNNEQHISIQRRNGDWLADELNNANPVANCSFICNNAAVAINGAATICGLPENYTITGLPANTPITWTSLPPGIVNINPAGPTTNTTTTLTRTGNSTITLTATVNACGTTKSFTKPISVGILPQPGPITFSLIDPTFGKLFANIEPVFGATSYNWYMNGALNTMYHGVSAHFSIPRNQCDIEYDIAVEAINGCGTSLQSHANAYVPCYYYYMVSPNPASGKLSVSVDQTKSAKGATATFDEVRIYDMQGNLKMNQKFNKTTTASINISSLINGDYYIEISNGANKERKLLLIRK